MQLQALQAFEDNYIWMLSRDGDAWVVDPGDASPVIHALDAQSLRLSGILITHHHGDHTGGVATLQAAHPEALVYGPANEPLKFPHQAVREGDTVDVFGTGFRVLDIPGHTAGHIAYFAEVADDAPLLFCGDTLFYGGCGRVFEGTPAQMWTSLQKLMALPGATRVCCAHEYTLANLRFAQAVDPNNSDLQTAVANCQALRAQGQSTLPSTIAHELRINPFLRCASPEARAAARAQAGQDLNNDSAVFAALREWKNNFR